MVKCRLLGHRFRFGTEGAEMWWRCERGCGARGSKRYGSADDAQRYAAAFDRQDSANLGRRAPLSALPLRLRKRREHKDATIHPIGANRPGSDRSGQSDTH